VNEVSVRRVSPRVLLPVTALSALAVLVCWRAWSDVVGAKRALGLDAAALARAMGTGRGAVSTLVIVHGAIGAVGAWWWLRRRGLASGAAAAGGVLLAVVPAAAGVSSWGLVLGVAWVPWALAAVDAWAARPAPGAAVGAGAALAMGAVGGGRSALGVALVVVVPVAVAAVVEARRSAPWPARVAAWTGAIAAALVAVAASLPLARPALPPSHALPVRALEALVLPRVGPGPYLGLLALAAAVAALALRPGARTLALAAAFVAGLALALVHDARWLDATRLAAAGLAAEGLHALATLDDDTARRRSLAVVALVAAAVAFAYGLGFVTTRTPWNKPSPLRDACSLGLAAALVSAWTLRGLLIDTSRARRAFTAVAALVLALDLWMTHHPALETLFR
jgi:hypothetical protein